MKLPNNILAVGLVVLLAGSMLIFTALQIFGTGFEGKEEGEHSNSYTATGHRAFAEWLEALEFDVTRNHSRQQFLLHQGLFIYCAPDAHNFPSLEEFLDRQTWSDAVLLVLPKREITNLTGERDTTRVLKYTLRENCRVLLDPEAELKLNKRSLQEIALEERWRNDLISQTFPNIEEVQTLETYEFEPLIGRAKTRGKPAEVLFGRHRSKRNLYVLTDADLVTNYGLYRPGNPTQLKAIIDYIVAEMGLYRPPIIFDEVSHGFEWENSIWAAAFRMPFALTTLSALIVLTLFLWFAVGRFGRPLAPPPAVPGGQEFLIDNTAQLLSFGGRDGYTIRLYWRDAKEFVSTRHKVPEEIKSGSKEQAMAWLQARTDGRHIDFDVEETDEFMLQLHERRPSRQVLERVRSIQQWKEQMTHGS